jgi:hypothetical protein
VPVDEAVAKLIEEYDPDDCEDEAAEFWFALASAQIQTGRLTELVKKRALELIASGAGLEAFARDCPDELPARKRAIKRLEKKILGPQKKPTKIKKAFVDTIEWEAGDGLAYQLPSGMWTGLKVREVERTPKYQEGRYEVLDLYQEAMPTAEDMRSAEVHLSFQTNEQLRELEKQKPFLITLAQASSRILDKPIRSEAIDRYDAQIRFAKGLSVISLSRSGVRDKPGGELVRVAQGLEWERYRNSVCVHFGGWKDLDSYLEESYGLK